MHPPLAQRPRRLAHVALRLRQRPGDARVQLAIGRRQRARRGRRRARRRGRLHPHDAVDAAPHQHLFQFAHVEPPAVAYAGSIPVSGAIRSPSASVARPAQQHDASRPMSSRRSRSGVIMERNRTAARTDRTATSSPRRPPAIYDRRSRPPPRCSRQPLPPRNSGRIPVARAVRGTPRRKQPPRETPTVPKLCEDGDSNPDGCYPLAPQASASTKFRHPRAER